MGKRNGFHPPPVPDGAAKAIRANLRGLRETAGLTAAELSAAAGLSPAAVSQIERGANAPGLGTLFALAAALDVQVWQFFAGAPAGGRKSISKKM